ncbi:hypothetical protein [Maridesulfovibrio sp.]
MESENAKAVAFISWVDCLERFDVLIEELRHIQYNIAFQLRSEPLYLMGLYEEAFLDANYEMFSHFYEYNRRHRKLLSFAIMPDFPSPRQLKSMFLSTDLLAKTEHPSLVTQLTENCLSLLNNLNCSKVKTDDWKSSKQAQLLKKIFGTKNKIWPREIDRNVRNLLKEDQIDDFVADGLAAGEISLELLSGSMTLGLFQFWQATFWSLDQRQLYYNLRATQALKRAIFNDKIFLLHKGVEAFIKSSPDHEEKMYEVLTIRRALLLKCEGYIQKVSAHQSCVAESFEHGEQELTRPLINRRKDQALYSRILNDICANTFQEMGHLLKDCGETIDFENRDVSLIHHWDYQYTSEYSSLYRPHSIVTHSYFKTSYWMPDRPDLQSAIIHEVGHVFTDETFKRFEQSYFSSNHNQFSSLFIRLRNILKAYDVELRSGLPINLILQEVGVDILAASVKGPSYLYVLALEILGEAIETMYGKTIDSLYEKQLDPSEAFIYDLEETAFLWHFRLHIVCTWIELLNDNFTMKDRSFTGLTSRLIDGVRNLADGLLQQVQTWIERNIGGLRENQRLWNYHKDLKEALCRTITTSRLPVFVRKHLIKKENTLNTTNVKTKPLHSFSPKTQEFLFNGLLSHKYKFKEKCDEKLNSLRDIVNFFYTQYGVEILLEDDEHGAQNIKYKEISIFKFLHDIPWQCALMKGIDFTTLTRRKDSARDNSMLAYTLMRPALGRGIYQVAVDYFYHNVENPLYHLEECTSQLAALTETESTPRMQKLFKDINDSIKNCAINPNKNELNRTISFFINDNCIHSEEIDNIIKKTTESLRYFYENPNELDTKYYLVDNDKIFKAQQTILNTTRAILKNIFRTLDKSVDVRLFRIKAELSFLTANTPTNWKKYRNTILANFLYALLTEHRTDSFAQDVAKDIIESIGCDYKCITLQTEEDGAQHKIEKCIKNNIESYSTTEEFAITEQIASLISQHIDKEWHIEISQLHSFLSCLYENEELGDDILCRAMSQDLCRETELGLNLDAGKISGGANIWTLNKITTAHLNKIELDNYNDIDTESSLMKLTPVLGKYDFMSITPDNFPSPVRINTLNLFRNKSFPFFIRRETVIPILISNIDIKSNNNQETETIALICIRMNRSTWRLHFLLRILKSYIHLNNNITCNTDLNNLNAIPCDLDIASCLKNTDRIYLSDGSNDLFFEIRGTPSSRINDVFRLKDILFDDYQTSVVETMPGAALISQASSNSNFKLVLCLQIRQSRDLSRSLNKVKSSLKKHFALSIKELSSLHGKMDIRIVFTDETSFNSISELVQKLITSCGDKINSMQLNIEEIIHF